MKEFLRKVMRGDETGLPARSLRAALRVPELIYSGMMRLRNLAYDIGILAVHRLPVPVISVGNITTGGTGKTPVVALVCQLLQQCGRHPGIVSRGYRATSNDGNDEKRVLRILVPDVPHEQNPDRVEGGQNLLKEEGTTCDCLVMDDGMQHRRLHRNLNLVLIDATCPFGSGQVLPRGLLREPLTGLRRADMILMTRCDLVPAEELERLENRLRQISSLPKERILRSEFRPQGLRTQSGLIRPLKAATVFLMSGIGNPEAFRRTCESAGLRIAGTHWFPDHHDFTTEELAVVRQAAAKSGAVMIVVTLKDLVKLSPADGDIMALDIAIQLTRPEDLTTLRSLVERAARSA